MYLATEDPSPVGIKYSVSVTQSVGFAPRVFDYMYSELIYAAGLQSRKVWEIAFNLDSASGKNRNFWLSGMTWFRCLAWCLGISPVVTIPEGLDGLVKIRTVEKVLSNWKATVQWCSCCAFRSCIPCLFLCCQ